MSSLSRKAVKLRRYWARRLRPSTDLPVYWHVGRPNFGDDLNPLFFEAVGGRGVRFSRDREEPHFMGIGSILEQANARSTVMGSGFLFPPGPSVSKPARIVSLRGHLSRAAFEGVEDIWLGDPLVVVDVVRPASAPKRHRYGYVPHVSSINEAKAMTPAGMLLIDPSAPPWQVIDQIASCEAIVSQSLHGLVVADAYGIPNLWIAPGAAMAGGRFKFDDYFSTLDQPKIAFRASADLLARPPADAFSACRYVHDKTRYLAILAEALCAGAATKGNEHPDR